MAKATESTDAAAAWLHLLKEGGRQTIAEIAQGAGLDRGAVHTSFQRLPDSGAVRKHMPDRDHRNVRFSITPGCTIPRGITLQQLAEAGAISLEAE